MSDRQLSSQLAVGQLPSLKEPRLLNGMDGRCWLLWLEQRPFERGRTTTLIRPFGAPELPCQELTPAPHNLRSRVHDYGGGVLASAVEGNTLILVWVNDIDRCLWRQDWKLPEHDSQDLIPCQAPARLTEPGQGDLADGLLDLRRNRWIGVREQAGRDELVCVELSERDQIPRTLYAPIDFVGYACISPEGDQLAWVEWQQPAMPWESSELWWTRLDRNGQPQAPRCVAGGKGISVFQPQWLNNSQLLIAEDSSGWWNLSIGNPSTGHWDKPWPMHAETGMPQWVYGMRTTAWDGTSVLAAVCANGHWQLLRLGLDGQVDPVDQPFDDLAGLWSLEGRAVAIASNSTSAAGLLELNLNDDASSRWIHTPAVELPMEQEAISVAEPLWFEGFGGLRTHAWYYPPTGSAPDANRPPPLLVKSHSGPTAMARCGLNLAIQYWTSRGWGVVDVNYGGSTGFGRAYRERLQQGWGAVDVADCAAAARALIASGQAHPQQIAIEGGSAGGFTTLACLCFTDVFKVGACRYAVCDLSAMAQDTHRFEARYLDGLVGAWPAERARYEARSPLKHADQIRCPVLFFQGAEDRVVPPEQTERMAAALRANGIPVEVCLFEHEGHGFRDSAVQIKVLEDTEAFFRRQLALAE